MSRRGAFGRDGDGEWRTERTGGEGRVDRGALDGRVCIFGTSPSGFLAPGRGCEKPNFGTSGRLGGVKWQARPEQGCEDGMVTRLCEGKKGERLVPLWYWIPLPRVG